LIAGETKEETASSPLTVTVKDPTPKKSESVFSRLTQGSADRNRSRITVDTGSAASSVQQPTKKRSLFGDSSTRDITKSLAKKFESTPRRPAATAEDANVLRRSTSIRTERPRSAFYAPMPEPSTISNGTNGSTLGRTTSFRMGNRPGQQPAAASNSGADQSMKNKIATGYTSALINLTRPFRKSREENEKVKGRDFDADSLSP